MCKGEIALMVVFALLKIDGHQPVFVHREATAVLCCMRTKGRHGNQGTVCVCVCVRARKCVYVLLRCFILVN